MSWMNALTPMAWIALLVVPPLIVLLYFLKLRRRPVEVPSTFLWRKALEDLHVNSLWQRIRNNLLLYLQLLAVFLLALACLRPGCSSTKLSEARSIFVVDVSASMGATDLKGGISRLEDAKRQISNLIDAMAMDDLGMIISFSDQAVVWQSYTNSKALLKQKLNDIEQSQRATDITEALDAAAGLANPGRTKTDDGYQQVTEGQKATLYIFSDGGFSQVPDFTFGNLTPEFHSIGGLEPPRNLGITAFAINDEVSLSDKREAFVQILNASEVEETVDVSLYVEDLLFDAQKGIRIPPGRQSGISFPLTALFQNMKSATRLKAVIENRDDLAQDNVAFTVVNPPRLARVLIATPGNDYLKIALSTEPIQKAAQVTFESRDFLQSEEFKRKATLGEYDLVIFDQCQPESMPNCNTMFFGNIPPSETWKMGEKQFPSPITDFMRTHPVLSNLQLTSVTIIEARKLEGPPGTLSLLDSVYGSIMAIGPREGFQDLVLSFPLAEFSEQGLQANTDWPNRLSFPLFMQNVVNGLAGGSRFISSENVSPGETARLRPPPVVAKVEIEAPDGRKSSVPRDANNVVIFPQTELSGIYRVNPIEFTTPEPPQPQLFSVNLFNPNESRIAVRDTVDIGFETITATKTRVPATTEYWKWIVAGTLAVLLLEWIIYNRRVLI